MKQSFGVFIFMLHLQHLSLLPSGEVCTAQILIPSESVYSELLQPHFLKDILGNFTDVTLTFDTSTLMLQVDGTPESISFVKSEVFDALKRLKSKKIKMEPTLFTYLKSRGSENVSRTHFFPAEIHATIDVLSDSSVVIYGLSHYDINRAEKTLKEDLDTKEVHFPGEEAASVVQTKNFADFVEDLNKTRTGVQVNIVTSVHNNEKKVACILAGMKPDLIAVEKEICEFIHEQSKVTVGLELAGGVELAESLPMLLDKLGLSHLSRSVSWRSDLKNLELTGTQKEIDEAMAAIEEKTKGLQCTTVTICRPGAYSYFTANGQEFLKSLGSMLSCMAVLKTEPEEVSLQVSVLCLPFNLTI